MQSTGTGVQRAATYLRVSTLGQTKDGYGLPEQAAVTATRCRERGYQLVEEVRDEAASGRLENREGLDRLLALARAGQIDVVVATNITRLGRENELIQRMLRQVRQAGTRVEFVEHGGGSSPADRLLENVLGGISEMEWEQVRHRTMNGRRRKALEKKVMPTAKAPLGFRCISRAEADVFPQYRGRDGEYEVVEDQAALVVRLFEMAAGGATLREMSRWIGEQGHPRYPSAIRGILLNRAYIGAAAYGKQRHWKVEGKRFRVPVPESEWNILPCPALVSPELFEAAGERMKFNQEALRGRPPAQIWPLRAVVCCAVCRGKRGAPRNCPGKGGPPSRFRRRYVCPSASIPGGFCGALHAADELEAMAREALRRAAAGALVEAERARAEAALQAAGDPARAARRAESELAEVTAMEENLLDRALTGGFSSSLLARKQEELRTRREAAEATLREARVAQVRLIAPAEAARRAHVAAERLREGLEEALADPLRFRDLCRRHLHIVLTPGEAPTIEVRVPVAATPSAE